MSMEPQSPLSRALASVRLPDVWELAPDGGDPPRKDGLVSSPFRPDRNPSFSVFAGLARWEDFATKEKGGVWDFVAKARPDWSKADLARFLIERAGLAHEDAASPPPPRKSASTLARERTEANRRARADFYRARNAPPPSPEPSAPWPAFVRDHFFREPVEDARIGALAKRRGWPVDWAAWLVDADWLRFPALPWIGKRFPAFVVGLPGAEPIGYHQRIWTAQDGPAWLFVPYRPRNPGRGLSAALASWNGPRVQPLPFVLGDPAGGSLWVICEGQWDAITLAGAFGFFEDGWELPMCFFGLRGASAGPGVFLAHYGNRLRAQKPRVWLWPDADRAGDTWSAAPADFSNPRPLTFAERLIELTGRAEIPVTTPPQPYGDFNDYYKGELPARTELIDLLRGEFPGWP
jgi:hypothetical protein